MGVLGGAVIVFITWIGSRSDVEIGTSVYVRGFFTAFAIFAVVDAIKKLARGRRDHNAEAED